MTMRSLLFFTALVSLLLHSKAFQPIASPPQTGRLGVIRHATVPKVNERPRLISRGRQSPTTKSDPSALTFQGRIVKTSRPLVPLQDKDFLVDFFQSDRARNTLFVSDAPPVPIEPVSNQLFLEWQAETQRLGATLPTGASSSSERVMQLCSNGISFSGLHVETTVQCGSKLIESDPVTGLPVYELTMIKDKTQARGPKLLMWIYNQVMSVVSKDNSSDKTTTSLCRISLVEKNGGVALEFVSDFEVSMKFPRFLLRVLPVSKSRAEQQGRSALTSFVEKGVVESIHRFETAFAAASRLAP
ncbi:expressed unknown protein [Seminavis robusta]|uniref:Uncharacterized protein n=1 Tax=Seminavis robusta TaxID=568900 RepID=A0A9N8H5R6_9STRA|nr:expressed unknown protein [Seminavis robusta]|eukprot:Sro150_g068820.1 n/a (301) ;mRNA; r:50426-51328